MRFQRDWGNLTQRLESEVNNQGGANIDPRMYKPKLSKDGTFSALVRFLPAPADEVPLVKSFNHRFKDRNGEYNEMCPTTIGKPCPICDANRPIYDTKDKALIKKVAKPRTRNKAGIANILIISDPQVPLNNGKVFLWRFGKQILDKIMNTCFPDENMIKTGAKPINIFDYYTGVNFRIIINKVQDEDGRSYPSYISSQFDTTIAPIGASPNNPNGDEEIMAIIEKQLYSLKEFSQPERFKSYEQLLATFNSVQGVASSAPAAMQAPAPAQPVQPTAQVPPPVQPATASYPSAATTNPPQFQSTPMTAPVSTIPPTQPPPAVDPALNFDAAETQSEDDFWASVKKNKQG